MSLAAPAATEPLVGIDGWRWPDLVRVPRVPVRAALARAMFQRALRSLPLTLADAGGQRLAGAGGAGDPTLRVLRPAEFWHRVGAHGLIGLGEAYQTGAWDSTDLVGLLTVLARNVDTLVPAPLQRLRALHDTSIPTALDNDPRGARRNIEAHYDLSNEMFALFLDESMTYSSALFPAGAYGAAGSGDVNTPDADALRAGQLAKIDALLDAVGLRAGERLLEIGSGWGGLALRAAGRGARVLGLTLSQQQLALATSKARAAGLDDLVRIECADYREIDGRFDVLVSVEMIEAVGERYWPAYFRALDRLLAPGGRVGVQAILMPDARLRSCHNALTWITKYIFPGGLIPSLEAIERTAATHTSLRLVRRHDFGDCYAATLRAWRHRFEEAWPHIRALGFDEVFRRTWRFYLAYSEAGFASGYLKVSQLVFTR
jgi:cyclopropane-fatty-acyl-phospholipid synthase